VLDQVAVEGLPATGSLRLSNFFRRRFVIPLVAACLVAGFVFCFWLPWHPHQQSVIANLVEDHLRYLPSEEQTQVALLSPGQIEAWFRKTPDFAVRVLECANLRLTGGVCSYLFEQRTAHLAYEHGEKKLSLFVFRDRPLELHEISWMDRAGKRIGLGSHKGYNAAFWHQNGLAYALVANSSKEELVDLAAHHIKPGVELPQTTAHSLIPGIDLGDENDSCKILADGPL
jgi:anti-sigma factor RsiW